MEMGRLQIDYEQVLVHANHLVSNVRDRFAGTAAALEAAEYIADVLRQRGVACDLLKSQLYVSVPESSRIVVLGDTGLDVSSVPFANSATTGPDGIEAEVVFLGPGAESDFSQHDVSGKIVLVESSYSPPRQEKIRLASVHGAVGIIIMHWGDEDSDLMVRGNAKAVWGNPELADLPHLPQIPAVGVSRHDGNLLAERTTGSTLQCRLVTSARQFWDNSALLPLVRLPGAVNPKEIVIIGGHYDAWSGGATDNAVGVGLMLELATKLSAQMEQLHRSIWIGFWPGHESTTMSGSTWFVDHFWDELTEGGAVYMNIDTLGLLESDQMFIHCSKELDDFAAEVSRVTLSEEPQLFPLARTGDQSFFGIGIPSIYGRTGFSDDVLARTHNATLGWWNHSHPSQDEMDKVDPRLVRKAGQVIENWIDAYATSPGLPGDYRATVREINDRLISLQPNAPDSLRIDTLINRGRDLMDQLDRFAQHKRNLSLDAANRIQLRLARLLTPVLSTVAGRYGQDPYGLSALKTRLPGLYLIESQPSTLADGAVLTTLIRQRNRIADALDQAIFETRVALASKGE